MQTVGQPMQCPELGLQPDQAPGVPLSEKMQQALSLICGYWQNQRVLLKASPSGILYVCSGQLQNVLHVTATSGNYTYQGTDTKCSEVMVMGHPDNAGKVWVRVHSAAAVNNAWPLDAKEVINFSITKLSMLHLLIVSDTEKAIIAYTM